MVQLGLDFLKVVKEEENRPDNENNIDDNGQNPLPENLLRTKAHAVVHQHRRPASDKPCQFQFTGRAAKKRDGSNATSC